MAKSHLSYDCILQSFPDSTQKRYFQKHPDIDVEGVSHLELINQLVVLDTEKNTDDRITFKEPTGYENKTFFELVQEFHSIRPDQSKNMMDKVRKRELNLVDQLLKDIPFKLPPSFNRYLSEIGIFDWGAQFFSGIISDETAKEDVMQLTLDIRDYCNLPESMFVISDDESSSYCYCLHPASADVNGECPVLVFDKEELTIDYVSALNFNIWMKHYLVGSIIAQREMHS